MINRRYKTKEEEDKYVAISRELVKAYRAKLPAIHSEMSNALKESKININLSFIPISQFNLKDTQGVLNQIVVVYKNGLFEILPRGMVGYRVKEYLGVNFNRVAFWGMLPLRGTEENPLPIRGARGPKQGKDIYNL